jgi:hypothetical protein
VSAIRVRSFDGQTVAELQSWVRSYVLEGPHPCEPLKRFAIGFYQLWQRDAWNDPDNRDESTAAAAIHFWAVAELLNLPVEDGLPFALEDIEPCPVNPARLLFVLSRAQQHVVYSGHPARIKRGSRYNQEQLRLDLREVISMLFGGIPRGRRGHATSLATAAMTGAL